MEYVEKALKTWINNNSVKASEELKSDALEKTEFVIQDGLFEHHKAFAYVGADGCLYYLEYFGKGWHKRRPCINGWCKYLGALMYNINSGKFMERREYERVGY